MGQFGRLCFVAVHRDGAWARHTGYAVDRGPRESEAAIDPALLFRYSALMFNGHCIHYDALWLSQHRRVTLYYPSLPQSIPLIPTRLFFHRITR